MTACRGARGPIQVTPRAPRSHSGAVHPAGCPQPRQCPTQPVGAPRAGGNTPDLGGCLLLGLQWFLCFRWVPPPQGCPSIGVPEPLRYLTSAVPPLVGYLHTSWCVYLRAASTSGATSPHDTPPQGYLQIGDNFTSWCPISQSPTSPGGASTSRYPPQGCLHLRNSSRSGLPPPHGVPSHRAPPQGSLHLMVITSGEPPPHGTPLGAASPPGITSPHDAPPEEPHLGGAPASGCPT